VPPLLGTKLCEFPHLADNETRFRVHAVPP
jgi:hypothetical protein